MFTSLLEMPASMEAVVIVAIAVIPAMLGAFVTWWFVSSVLAAVGRFSRRS